MHVTRLLSAVAATTLLSPFAVDAAENETVFLSNQGKLVIPHLVMGDNVYYAQLDRLGTSYNFDLNEATLVNITPREGDDWATVEEVVGDWMPEGSTGFMVSFEADGTYMMTVPGTAGCTGGTESGRWMLDESTGVLTANVDTDANGECGLSHPSAVMRLEREGNNVIVTLLRQQSSTEITLVPITSTSTTPPATESTTPSSESTTPATESTTPSENTTTTASTTGPAS